MGKMGEEFDRELDGLLAEGVDAARSRVKESLTSNPLPMWTRSPNRKHDMLPLLGILVVALFF